MRVTVLTASPSTGSSTTRTLAELALAQARERFADVEESRIEVYDLGSGFTSAVAREDVDAATEQALAAVERAELLIIAVPVFRASYPGLFKHFLDLLDQHALVRTPVMLLATGGSERHALIIDQVLRPQMAFFHALVLPTGVFARSGDVLDGMVLDPGVHTRIALCLDDVEALLAPEEARRAG